MSDGSTPRVAIVGAGAMGVMVGYHLSGAPVVLDLVTRQGQSAQIPETYRLYSYDDGHTYTFERFGVLSSPDDLVNNHYAFVIVALDGAALTSEEGRTVLARIGRAIRASGAVMVVGSIGVGLREWAIQASGLPEDRVLNGRLGLLCHRTKGVSLPLHRPTEPAQLAMAHFAMRHVSDGCFVVEDRGPPARELAELFRSSGQGVCHVVPCDVFALQSRSMFPLFALSDIMGYPPADGLTRDAELWTLTVDAVREIQRLGEHGEAGQSAATQQTGAALLAMWRSIEQAALPLDWQGFNAYQHGGRVKAADQLLLAACVTAGEAEGRTMTAVRMLLDRWVGSDR